MNMYDKRIVHLTSVHASNDVRIFQKECLSLAKIGYNVTLIVPSDNEFVSDSINVIRVAYPRSRFDRIFNVTRKIFIKALKLNADLYHFHDPELMPVGVLLKLFCKKVVYDVHEELANDILDKDWIPSCLRLVTAKFISLIEKLCSYAYDGIVITRPSLFKSFNKDKTVLVHNYPILGELRCANGVNYSQRAMVGAYVGGGTPVRGIKELVQSLQLLPDDIEFELHFAGIITPDSFLEELKKLPGWKRVRYLGWQTRSQVSDLLGRVRFGIVTFLPIANHLNSEPTKLFEYMSASLPVIGSNFPHWQALIEGYGFGILADPYNPKMIADAIIFMLQNPSAAEKMGRIGCDLVKEKYNWDVSFLNLLKLYKEIL
jgi:glycosyltransferase involved in cell wall biosynthesis